MDRLRMRTTLLLPLLILSFGVTVISLLVIRTIVLKQTAINLASDLEHSLKTYRNLQHHQQQMLARESALLADLPSLKALMTTHDAPTIADGGVEFWKVSGSDFFALLDQDGRLIVAYNHGAALNRADITDGLAIGLEKPGEPVLLALDNLLYEISIEPLYFGQKDGGTHLGYVAVGNAIDDRVARAVSEAAAAEVAFAVDGKVVVSTLNPMLQQQLIAEGGELLRSPIQDRKIRLGRENYLATSEPLRTFGVEESDTHAPQLVVLKSFAEATRLADSVNRWVVVLALLSLFAGVMILIAITRTLTRPIASLVGGTRALAQGNFDYKLSEDGTEEIRELSRAFERMRVQLQRTQKELLDSERLATIGRMASSISHDLRHYLSAMYANAEFMSNEKILQEEREELMVEVKTAVKGMTDMLDSLLLFTQTGRALHPELESIALLIQRAVSMLRSHPGTRDVQITLNGLTSLQVWADGKKLERAIYNLLLNACQAAKRGEHTAKVILNLSEDDEEIRIRIVDNGPGVPEAIRETIFLPFVSEGRESGTGLGLTLARQIVHEHGGSVALEETIEGFTAFTITLPKKALEALGAVVEKQGHATQTAAHGGN